jgi:zinc protease
MNYSRVFCASVVAGLILLTATVRAAEPKKVTTVEGITEYQLDNGLKLLLIPDSSSSKITISMTILVGSRHEGYGEAGMAHLLEHMLFKGSPTFPKVDELFRDRGADFNGTTSFDRTNYYETLPATEDNLQFAIRFEADRLVNCFIRREDLFSEMTVVRNEFERGENSPPNVLTERVMAAAYDWHNYGKTTIGNRSDIERVPINNLQDFYRRHYQPDNAVVIVAGKFDEASALKYAQQYFGAIPRPTRSLNTTYTVEPPQDGERLVTLRRTGTVPLLEMTYHVPALSHDDYAALEMLGVILSTPPVGRLYKALVETKLSSHVAAGPMDAHDPTVFMISADVRPESTVDAVKSAIVAALDEVIAKGVTAEEVQRAISRFLNARKAAAVDTNRFAIGLSEWIAVGDWRLYFLYRDRIEKVTPADVQRVAAKYFHASNRTVGSFIPLKEPDVVTVPPTPDVSKLVADYKGRPPVAAVPEFDYSFANVESKTTRKELPSGIKGAFLSKPTRDSKVELTLKLRYGNADNLKGQREAASFLSSLMCRGTKKLNYQQLTDELTRLDVEIGDGSAARGHIGGGAASVPGVAIFKVRARRESLSPALDLLAQILREPALDDQEFEVLKGSRITSAQQRLTDPGSLTDNALERTLKPYPSDDVRAIPTLEEDVTRLKAVMIEQVRKLYQEYLGATAGELTVVGDFDMEQTLAKVNQMLANWKPKQPYARIEQQAFMNVAGRTLPPIRTPGKANANYEAGLMLAINDRDRDYPALMLGTDILGGGGGLSSRLMDRIRQKDGLAYGVASPLLTGIEDRVSTFDIFATCNPANIAKVEAAVLEEVERLLKSGIPADEFERCRQGLQQSRQRQRNSDAYVASRLERSLRTGQTLAFDAQIDSQLAALTADDVLAALRKYIDPKRLVIVTAGDF